MQPRCSFAANAGWLGIAMQNVNETIGNDIKLVARGFVLLGMCRKVLFISQLAVESWPKCRDWYSEEPPSTK
jgi:hypothetical protein